MKRGRCRNQVVTLEVADPATGAIVSITVTTDIIEVHTGHPERFSKPVLETRGNDGVVSVELGGRLPGR
jgi:hypothetical protein